MSVQISRRNLLLGIAAAGGTATALMAAPSGPEEHPANPQARGDAVAMLYDNNICTGCNACVAACSTSNGLTPDTSLSAGRWQMPSDLNSKTKNIVKLYKQPDETRSAFIKRQCMHCLDPACVSGCPFGAPRRTGLAP